MITKRPANSTPRDHVIADFLNLVKRSGVCDLLREAVRRQRGPGGRPANEAITYSLEGVLVATFVLLNQTRTPSMAAVMQLLLQEMTPDQRDLVGVTRGIPEMENSEWKREYQRFQKWLTRALSPMDSAFDLRAQRATPSEDAAITAARTAKQSRRSRVAHRIAERVINRIIAESVLDPAPAGYRGDVVADESILHVSNQSKRADDGDWTRSGVSIGAYYSHESRKGEKTGKRGHGVGVTAVVRVGPPDATHTVTPVVTGIAIHKPTSGTPRHLEAALAQHRRNGFDGPPRGKNAAYPFCVTDMGYTAKKDYAGILFRRNYALLSRFPEPHNHVHPLLAPNGEETGVVQIGGDVYCPCAEKLAIAKAAMVIGTSGLDAQKADRHDRLLQQTHPMLMGRNSRVRQAGAPGRPKQGQPKEQQYRIDLVCPAVQGRVRCPLKPESMVQVGEHAVPELNPSWNAEDKLACANSQVTVTLPDKAFRQFHPSLPASSWEHTFLYESYRSMTERTFAIWKSKHISPCQDLTWTPRRAPYLMLVVATSLAVMNLKVQESAPFKKNQNPFQRSMRELEEMLGREPTRVPPRT